VLRVDSPFSEDGGDGRPGYESMKVPFDPGTGSGCRLEGGVNRRIKNYHFKTLVLTLLKD
jgi:hypothetical protein